MLVSFFRPSSLLLLGFGRIKRSVLERTFARTRAAGVTCTHRVPPGATGYTICPATRIEKTEPYGALYVPVLSLPMSLRWKKYQEWRRTTGTSIKVKESYTYIRRYLGNRTRVRGTTIACRIESRLPIPIAMGASCTQRGALLLRILYLPLELVEPTSSSPRRNGTRRETWGSEPEIAQVFTPPWMNATEVRYTQAISHGRLFLSLPQKETDPWLGIRDPGRTA